MTDVPTAGRSNAFDLTHRIGGEVVVEHKRPVFFAAEGFHPLFVTSPPQRQDAEHLGLAAREQRTAMGPGQYPDLAGDRADFVESSVIDASAFFENHVTTNLLLEVAEDSTDLITPVCHLLTQ